MPESNTTDPATQDRLHGGKPPGRENFATFLGTEGGWAVRAAKALNMPSPERLILITVAERVDRDSMEWRGCVSQIMEDTGLSDRRVRSAFATAAATGLDQVLKISRVVNSLTFRLQRVSLQELRPVERPKGVRRAGNPAPREQWHGRSAVL